MSSAARGLRIPWQSASKHSTICVPGDRPAATAALGCPTSGIRAAMLCPSTPAGTVSSYSPTLEKEGTMPNDPLSQLQQVTQIYGPIPILINIALSLVLGLVIATLYRITHKGLSYSQSFTHTVVFIAVIVAIVMMVIGNSLSRAFALVGALSIIRFRTVVKDTKDTAYVFMALAAGMAAGTSNHFLAVAGTVIFALLSVGLFKVNFGAVYKSEFILRFVFDQDSSSVDYLEAINKFARRSNMLHMEPSGDGQFLKLTYDITMRENQTAEEFTRSLGRLDGVSEVTLIAAKHDVDY